jgi:hypothetical protein
LGVFGRSDRWSSWWGDDVDAVGGKTEGRGTSGAGSADAGEGFGPAGVDRGLEAVETWCAWSGEGRKRRDRSETRKRGRKEEKAKRKRGQPSPAQHQGERETKRFDVQ